MRYASRSRHLSHRLRRRALSQRQASMARCTKRSHCPRVARLSERKVKPFNRLVSWSVPGTRAQRRGFKILKSQLVKVSRKTRYLSSPLACSCPFFRVLRSFRSASSRPARFSVYLSGLTTNGLALKASVGLFCFRRWPRLILKAVQLLI